MIDLTGKTAIVTGGASGIGAGICRVLAQQGARVAVADLSNEGAETVAAELSRQDGEALAIQVDVTTRDSVHAMVNAVMAGLDRIDILVNNAGVVGAPGWWERPTPSDEDWDTVMGVNLRGAVNASEAVAPQMKERRYGKIVNIASIAARQGRPEIPAYCASKRAVVSWTQSLALQLAPYDVNVNAVCPGMLWTPLYERLTQYRSAFGLVPGLEHLSGEEHFQAEVESRIPLRRPQQPEDVGRLAAFLASDDAHNITGQAVNLDGGARMN